jgi:hypothetical protein
MYYATRYEGVNKKIFIGFRGLIGKINGPEGPCLEGYIVRIHVRKGRFALPCLLWWGVVILFFAEDGQATHDNLGGAFGIALFVCPLVCLYAALYVDQRPFADVAIGDLGCFVKANAFMPLDKLFALTCFV